MSVHSMVILELRSVDCRHRRQNDRRRGTGMKEGSEEGGWVGGIDFLNAQR